MSAAAALAALATLLALAAAREMLPRSSAGDPVRPPALPRGGRTLTAALWLGLPGRLARSGLTPRFSLGAVLAAKVVGAVGGALLALAAAPAAPGRTSLLVALGLPVAGFLAPDALLERAARRRRRRLLAALPDALDLLAVGSASGRPPGAGFAQIAASGHGPLAEEMRVTVAELGCGLPLPAALAGLRERVPGGEVATLCASIERSRRLGSPLAEQLRRQAAALRRERRRAIEDSAARAAPKIQLVVALILVPSVLLLIAAALLANADVLLAGF